MHAVIVQVEIESSQEDFVVRAGDRAGNSDAHTVVRQGQNLCLWNRLPERRPPVDSQDHRSLTEFTRGETADSN